MDLREHSPAEQSMIQTRRILIARFRPDDKRDTIGLANTANPSLLMIGQRAFGRLAFDLDTDTGTIRPLANRTNDMANNAIDIRLSGLATLDETVFVSLRSNIEGRDIVPPKKDAVRRPIDGP